MNGLRRTRKRLEILLLVSAIFMFSRGIAHASTEVTANAGAIGLGGGESQIALGGGYHREMLTWLQVGGSLFYQTLGHGETKVNTMTLRLGPTLNMDGPIPQSYFFSLGLTMRKGNGVIAAGADDPNAIGAYIQFGKRISLGGPFSFRPSVSASFAGGMHIRIEVLSVSYFF